MSEQEGCETGVEGRLVAANAMLEVIASCGRRFYLHKGRVGRLEVDHRGRAWFHDAWTGARVYTHYAGRWRLFTEGGTLKALVECLRDFVLRGEHVPAGVFGPWPEWVCGGDLWGYGADMQMVREAARRLGIVTPDSPAVPSLATPEPSHD